MQTPNQMREEWKKRYQGGDIPKIIGISADFWLTKVAEARRRELIIGNIQGECLEMATVKKQ